MRFNMSAPRVALLIAMSFALALPRAIFAQAASGPRVLYSFAGGSDGSYPIGPMVRDPQGNLYGATAEGGSDSPNCTPLCGTIFEMSHSGNIWTKATIYNFVGGDDGYFPEAGLVMGKDGNLYGTTYFGGGPRSSGTVFELEHTAYGWREKVIHRFNTIGDGVWPEATLTFDPKGNLFGTTLTGGKGGGYGGTVFELSPNSSGWTEHVLHGFSGPGDGDGAFPVSGVVLDSAGNIYGTADLGGTSTTCAYSFGCGIVFELSPNRDGTYTETILHNFDSIDGAGPGTTPVFDSSGNLFGATTYGGDGPYCSNGCGVFYELTPNADGTWTDQTLHQFAGGPTDGGSPINNFALDKSGNFYGTTYDGGGGGSGGLHQCQFDGGEYCGTVYELSLAGGVWTEKVVTSFSKGNGSEPFGIIIDPAGHLYGTAFFGGAGSAGVVFEVAP